ncbi:histidine phosphatase family protein [Lactobacillus mulieris]|jgi:alpha-ribazole phosphatase|uniref:histidine phosphatase family protein n=1 Tax=Lactobacillus mulieris TaxID=2508708 RepID=UPI00065E0962|nr:histidine phosphatase family protein [Lactobacillus mulieris]KAA9369065.1 histidine phosphatase family protein [Lactobacillus jensenii]KAA9372599.1 histidine phosphatase family protein [Lactobacillus jensenii]MCF1796559.1 histidine phosphatase family protein [Lactobacillus mulieris]MCF1847866.1 histidine phosphatase family protein [Lactobacillus mulieris]MCW8073335.1 histidine phosphatase family protein [Lactobacillus mulieris]
MTTEVYLIRHGETMFNQLNKVQGWADSPLTIKGINDLKKTAEVLSQIHFDNMYSSDLKRAIDTVHLMKNANEVSEIGKIKKLPEFREVFFGSFEGDDIDKTWEAIGQAAGVGPERNVQKIINQVGIYEFREATKKADPRHLAENSEELDTRMVRAIKKLQEETENENRVLLVSHGDFIKTLGIKYWNKSDRLHDIEFPDNGSITRGILSDDGKFEIVDYNIKAEDF